MLTVLIVVAITTLCICDVAILGLVASYVYNHTSRSYSRPDSPAPVSNGDLIRQGESEELERARREYMEQEKAFQMIMNYNAEQAYGMNDKPAEEISE